MLRIYRQSELVGQKLGADDLSCSCLGFVRAPQHEIVTIADVGSRFQAVQDELVEFIEVDVGENLAGQIANRQTVD